MSTANISLSHIKAEDYTRPSRQLLEFYRKKIAEYENEHDILVKKLADYGKSYAEQHHLDWEVKQREDEIAELQKSLADMQIFLFKEREQVLNLYKQNDGFKARDLENKRTIQQLLALQGGALDGEVSYFFKEPPEQSIITDKTRYKDSKNKKHQGENGKMFERQEVNQKKKSKPNRLKKLEEPDQVTLSLQVEALQSQISDQARWATEFIDALEEDKRIKVEEHDTRRERDVQKIKTVTEKLHHTQDMLYESTQDILRLRRDWKEAERKWFAEKDDLILELDTCRGRLNREAREKPNISFSQNTSLVKDSTAKYKFESKKLRNELDESRKMSEMYREQVISLEDEIASYKEKEHLKTDLYSDKIENMSKRYRVMKMRYEDLEKRRNLEVEGFKNDIKSLRKQLKDMERQLYKATAQFGTSIYHEQPEDLDLAVLHQVCKTASQSKQLGSKLKSVKNEVYSLEQDMRHL